MLYAWLPVYLHFPVVGSFFASHWKIYIDFKTSTINFFFCRKKINDILKKWNQWIENNIYLRRMYHGFHGFHGFHDFHGFFIHNIRSIYHFFMTALSAHVVLSVLYSTFPTLSKLTYSTYSVKNTWEEMNLFLWGISNRVFLNLHPVVVTVVITQSLSFLLPQHKRRFFFLSIDQRLTLHFIPAFTFTFLSTGLILGKVLYGIFLTL